MFFVCLCFCFPSLFPFTKDVETICEMKTITEGGKKKQSFIIVSVINSIIIALMV